MQTLSKTKTPSPLIGRRRTPISCLSFELFWLPFKESKEGWSQIYVTNFPYKASLSYVEHENDSKWLHLKLLNHFWSDTFVSSHWHGSHQLLWTNESPARRHSKPPSLRGVLTINFNNPNQPFTISFRTSQNQLQEIIFRQQQISYY